MALAARAELGAGLTAVEADQRESDALHALALSLALALALGGLGERLLGGSGVGVLVVPDVVSDGGAGGGGAGGWHLGRLGLGRGAA